MAKVRITSLGNNAKQLNWPVNPGMLSEPEVAVNKTLGPVDRSEANLEAEVGETVVTDLNGGGIPQQYNIGGKRHSAGGTPLNLPEDSFIFSRDNKMKIKDEKIQKMFGMAPSKSGYTPAEIAKKYDLNRYHKILADPNTDDLQRDTAEMMIAQYNLKLAKLAMVQESMKGFPTGIPKIAEPYMESGAINPEELNITQAMPEQPGQSEEGQTERKYGGDMSSRRVRIVALPKARDGKDVGKYPSIRDYAKDDGDFLNKKNYNKYFAEITNPDPKISVPAIRKYEGDWFVDKSQPNFGLPFVSDDGFHSALHNWNPSKLYMNIADLNYNQAWNEAQAAKAAKAPKKLPGKTEAKKALTTEELYTQAKKRADALPPEESFDLWKKLVKLKDKLTYMPYHEDMYLSNVAKNEAKIRELITEGNATKQGINSIPNDWFPAMGESGAMSYNDQILMLAELNKKAKLNNQLYKEEKLKELADWAKKYPEDVPKTSAKAPVKVTPVAQPIVKTTASTAKPYATWEEYKNSLDDAYTEEKAARQRAYIIANPDYFKRRGGELEMYKNGGGKVVSQDGPWQTFEDGSIVHELNGKVKKEGDDAWWAAQSKVQSTGTANAAATSQQSKGNFNYVDRDKFSKDAVQAGGYDVIYGPDNLGNLPSQKFDPKTNTYYHLDKNGKRVDVDMADFAKRHAWFADAVKASNAILASQGLPGVDAEKIFTDMQSPDKATRRRATNMFQTAHSRMSKKLGIPQYFTEGNNPNDPTSIDSMFGNYTENAPVFRRSATKTTERDPAVDRKKDDGAAIKENPLVPQYDTYPDAWFPQDLNNIGLAQREKSRIPQEMEWGAIASARMAPYVLRSPERALAANSEAQNIASQNINAYGFNPTANRASIAAASGKAAANAANIEAQVEADNIGTQNAAWARNADTANRFGMYAAGERNDQYHNQLGMNRDRISALNKSDREIVRNINQGITNTADAHNTNLLNDNYKIDPRTGGKIYFTPTGRKIQAITPQEEMAKKFLSYKERLPGVADDVVLKMMGLG